MPNEILFFVAGALGLSMIAVLAVLLVTFFTVGQRAMAVVGRPPEST